MPVYNHHKLIAFTFCVCLFAQSYAGPRMEKSKDGQVYHSYLKGHSIIVGAHLQNLPVVTEREDDPVEGDGEEE